ncbi:hypothetical protein BDP27DRAFT_1417954 [Rhodocollybia butyracea]|uniref:Protein kinase domain-containing protein n=1 Tax=Rhodocollybia butyracea TaxID=206335 RepID=A0A9P5PZ71_9AGAR|nr:hypothetical protein BDP27DRAFT_1417954 [Rhodocollybia butyracea]
MQREAENYAPLRNVQGRVIPRMFGYWEAQPEENEKPWGFLFIEHFGDRLTAPFRYLEFWERAVLLNHLRDIHNQGLVHNYFHPGNVLQKDKKFRLIDLEDLTPHNCYECEVDFMIAGRMMARRNTGGLVHECLARSNSVGWISFTRTQNLPSHKMMSALFPQCIRAQYRQNAALAEFLSRYYQRVCQKMVDLGLEDRKEFVARPGKEAPQIFSDLKVEFSSRLELKPCCGTKHPSGLGYMSLAGLYWH